MESTSNIVVFDWKLLISLLALFVAIFTFLFNIYLQYVQKPKVYTIASNPIFLFYGVDFNLFFQCHLTFFNHGAKNAVILRTEGLIEKIEPLDNKPEEFVWKAFIDSKDTGLEEGIYKPTSYAKSLAKPIIVPKREAIVETVNFATKQKFIIEPGNYRFRIFVEGLKGEKKIKKLSRVIFKIQVSDQDCSYLKKQCQSDPDTKKSKSSLEKDFI